MTGGPFCSRFRLYSRIWTYSSSLKFGWLRWISGGQSLAVFFFRHVASINSKTHLVPAKGQTKGQLALQMTPKVLCFMLCDGGYVWRGLPIFAWCGVVGYLPRTLAQAVTQLCLNPALGGAWGALLQVMPRISATIQLKYIVLRYWGRQFELC